MVGGRAEILIRVVQERLGGEALGTERVQEANLPRNFAATRSREMEDVRGIWNQKRA